MLLGDFNMTFNSKVKSELCRIGVFPGCCAKAELYGALLLGQRFDPAGIRVVTRHPGFLGRLNNLLNAAFDVDAAFGDSLYIPPPLCAVIYEAYGYGDPGIALHLNNAILENDCCQAAFWRGAFLAGGAVTDPIKSYHLEIVTPRLPLSRELSTLMLECGFYTKQTTRSGAQVLYFKASESIEDFLTLIGAPICAMDVMETKIEKDLRNRVNRAVNCETGNVTRTVEAYARQRVAIERLMNSERWDTLPDELKKTASERLANPEESLAELASQLGVGRSGLNHRLRKLEKMGNSI